MRTVIGHYAESGLMASSEGIVADTQGCCTVVVGQCEAGEE